MNQHVTSMCTDPALVLIPKDQAPSVLPMVADTIVSVADRSNGRFTPAGIAKRFMEGEWSLWVIWNGSIMATGATLIADDDDGSKALQIVFWSGDNSSAWLHLLDELEFWAKQHRCSRVRGVMRKGWAKKLPEFRMTHVCLEKDIS